MARTILLLCLLSALRVPSAYADVSDSGNLTIGGQGVVAGTMTVQGNAFSVGGSTFAVLAGTVNVGGLLKLSAAGIQWNDGKVSTTSATGGGGGVGDAVLTSSQTFSGANVFTSSTQFGTGASRSTFTAYPGGSTYALQLSSGVTIAGGGAINLTSGGFIRFADGTISTTAVSGGGGGGGSVAASTCVYPSPTASIPVNANPNVFTASATITISQNSRIRMWAFGNQGANTSSAGTNFWINNAIPAGFGNPTCVTAPATATTLGVHACDRMTEPLAAGTYNLGWAAGMNGGSAANFYNGYGSFQPFFCAMEVKTQ